VVSGKTGENIQKVFSRLTQLVYEHYVEKKGGQVRIGLKLHEMVKEDEPTKKKCC
jgi:DNA-binding IclR family transcriptional regulator